MKKKRRIFNAWTSKTVKVTPKVTFIDRPNDGMPCLRFNDVSVKLPTAFIDMSQRALKVSLMVSNGKPDKRDIALFKAITENTKYNYHANHYLDLHVANKNIRYTVIADRIVNVEAK